MVIKFTVKNFRSIKNQVTLDLQASSDTTRAKDATVLKGKTQLLRSAAIFGANASGKSSIVMALGLMRQLVLESQNKSLKPGALPNNAFKFDKKTEKLPTLFELTFHIDNEIYKYGVEFTKQYISSEYLIKEKGNVTLFSRQKQEIESNKNSFKEATETIKKQTNEKTLFLTVLASNNGKMARKVVEVFQNINVINGLALNSTLDYSFKQFVSNSARAEKMKELITQADFGVSNISATEEVIPADEIPFVPDKFKQAFFQPDSMVARRRLSFIHNGIPLDFMTEESEGTQQFFSLSAPIIDTLENGRLLVIDESSSLHPILCQYMLALFNSHEKNKNGAQLILVTHDTSIMDEGILRRDQIYFTDKNSDGVTSLYSLADISERKGLDFAKRYFEGRYDALPYIKEYEELKFHQE